ncbi:unnamed protein product [Porites evermanni]|uniref:Uncharacterized protein n=1 Tax=Porites evermanni TaxID=104178 RepID=A0ABN8Q315_9CNID|nr:unnamed protein product [Porites evermanni]
MIKTLLGQKKATEDLAAKLNTVPTYRRQNVQPQLQLQQRQPRINVDGDSVINVEHQETARNCSARSEKVMLLKGNRTTAIVNGPEKYDTLEHSFSLVINDNNCETVPLGALLNFE